MKFRKTSKSWSSSSILPIKTKAIHPTVINKTTDPKKYKKFANKFPSKKRLKRLTTIIKLKILIRPIPFSVYIAIDVFFVNSAPSLILPGKSLLTNRNNKITHKNYSINPFYIILEKLLAFINRHIFHLLNISLILSQCKVHCLLL